VDLGELQLLPKLGSFKSYKKPLKDA
jgi:hypothetical protein